MKGSSLFSWVFTGRRGENSRNKPEEINSNNCKKNVCGGAAAAEELGVTDELKEFVKTFTVQTFKDFPQPQPRPISDDRIEASVSTKLPNVREDLTHWQERHATFVLAAIKEVSHLRYVLCPRHLKENQFWRIYFSLVKTYVAPYEIRAIQKVKIKMMESMHEKPVEKIANEVEMTDAKQMADGSSYDLENDS